MGGGPFEKASSQISVELYWVQRIDCIAVLLIFFHPFGTKMWIKKNITTARFGVLFFVFFLSFQTVAR